MATAVFYSERANETSMMEEVSFWLTMLPTLFITAGGRIQTESAPIAFRFTAMEEDSLVRQLIRLACSVLVVLLISSRMRETLAACRRSKMLLLIPAIAFASILWSQSPRHSVIDSVNLLLTTLFAIHLLGRYPGEKIVTFLNVAAFIALLLCAISVLAFPAIGIDSYQQGAWRGIFGQRNNCATSCVLFLTVALHTQTRGLVEQLIRGSVIFLSTVFIIMSGSRTGWIAAALAVVLTYAFRLLVRISSLDRIFTLMVLAVPLSLAVFMMSTNFNQILAALDKDPTLTQRTIIWAQVLPSILKHPLLGYGYSAFWAGLNGESMQTVLTTGWMEGQAQDGYLDILLQLGLLGLVPIILLFLNAFKTAASLIERKLADPRVLLATVLLPIILIENVGETSLVLPLNLAWFYALIALLILSTSATNAEES